MKNSAFSILTTDQRPTTNDHQLRTDAMHCVCTDYGRANPMRASVIVVAYNSRADLPACLDSILADLGPDDELIVVDNGSTDGCAELVENNYPQVQLIRATNTGYAGGNNRGAAAAHGDYLVFLNPDTVTAPGALGALIAPLAKLGSTALTTACVVLMDRPETVNTCGNTMHFTGLTYCRGAGRPAAYYHEPAEVDAVSGAAFAIRRAIFEQLRGFDEQFFMYVEDSDLSLRARLAGYRCDYVPAARVLHNYRMGYSPGKAFYLERNRHLMLLKNLSGATYLRLLPGLLLGELVTTGFLLLKGPHYWSVKPRVYRWLWAQRGDIAAARRLVRARGKPELAVLGRLAYRLEFGQLAGRLLAGAAAALFHPAFWLARLPLGGGRG